MKRFTVALWGVLFLSLPVLQTAKAQMLDDLFDEDDFDASEIDKMQQKEASRKKTVSAAPAVPKQVSAPAVSKPVSAPAAKPILKPITETGKMPSSQGGAPLKQTVPRPVEQPKIQTPAPAVPVAAPRTFNLSPMPQAIAPKPSLPELGIGKNEDALPNLGINAKKNDENLSLFEMRARKKKHKSTDVSKFDIAGIKLKMKPQEVIELAEKAGFTLKFENRKIPEIREWKYHRQCLKQMFFSYDSKKNCIKETARLNQSEYVSALVFENKPLRETLNIEFTSTFSDNHVYRIRYVNKGDHSLGSTNEAKYLKIKRREEFLDQLIRKYGAPDDELALMWGISGLSATLQADISEGALDATLVMEDTSDQENDFDAVLADDLKSGLTDKFSF